MKYKSIDRYLISRKLSFVCLTLLPYEYISEQIQLALPIAGKEKNACFLSSNECEEVFGFEKHEFFCSFHVCDSKKRHFIHQQQQQRIFAIARYQCRWIDP